MTEKAGAAPPNKWAFYISIVTTLGLGVPALVTAVSSLLNTSEGYELLKKTVEEARDERDEIFGLIGKLDDKVDGLLFEQAKNEGRRETRSERREGRRERRVHVPDEAKSDVGSPFHEVTVTGLFDEEEEEPPTPALSPAAAGTAQPKPRPGGMAGGGGGADTAGVGGSTEETVVTAEVYIEPVREERKPVAKRAPRFKLPKSL